MATNDDIPDNIDDWMRWVERRLRTLERHRHALTAGNWALKENEAGQLVAVYRDGTETVIASP